MNLGMVVNGQNRAFCVNRPTIPSEVRGLQGRYLTSLSTLQRVSSPELVFDQWPAKALVSVCSSLSLCRLHSVGSPCFQCPLCVWHLLIDKPAHNAPLLTYLFAHHCWKQSQNSQINLLLLSHFPLCLNLLTSF